MRLLPGRQVHADGRPSQDCAKHELQKLPERQVLFSERSSLVQELLGRALQQQCSPNILSVVRKRTIPGPNGTGVVQALRRGAMVKSAPQRPQHIVLFTAVCQWKISTEPRYYIQPQLGMPQLRCGSLQTSECAKCERLQVLPRRKVSERCWSSLLPRVRSRRVLFFRWSNLLLRVRSRQVLLFQRQY